MSTTMTINEVLDAAGEFAARDLARGGAAKCDVVAAIGNGRLADHVAERLAAHGPASSFHLDIDLGNAAMRETADVVAALRAVADRLETYGPTTEGACTDTNGNAVGTYSLVLPEPETRSVKVRALEEGMRIKIGDGFERIECVEEMPGDRVEVITEPYGEGVLWEAGGACDVLVEEEV